MANMDRTTTTESTRGSLHRDWLEAIRGKTIRFTFHEGPTKGKSYDHSFEEDGTVTWHDAAASERGSRSESARENGQPKEPPTKYGSFQVADDVYVVSYLSKAGYTLSVALNFETDELFGFASNHEHWYPVRGTFEVLE